MEQPVKKSTRIEVIDALRGFAVLAIVLVHNVEHFIFPVYPTQSPAWLSAVDAGVFSVVFSLFGGKAYAIFALLFGFTFYLQSDHQRQLGRDFGPRFLWRLVLLVGFATIDAAFFPAGDVLLLFVVVGLLLFLTRNWHDGALLTAALILLLQPVEWIYYIAHLISPDFLLPDLKVGELYARVAAYTQEGRWSEFLWGNITLGQRASLLWAIGAGRFVQTAGLFLLGCYIGRRGFFAPSERNLRLWTRILIVAAVAFAPLFSLKELVMTGDDLVRQTVGTALDMWQKLAFTFVLVSAFVLLYQSERFRRLVSPLRAYGKMSLTNYLSQSVVGALLYFPIGLYLAPYCGYTVSLLIGLLTFVLQLSFCRWWLRRHKQGPLERIWHRWTWLGTSK